MLGQIGGFSVGGLLAVLVAAGSGWFQDSAPTPVQPARVLATAPAVCAPAEAPATTSSLPPAASPATARRRAPEQDRVAANTVMAPVRYAVFRPDTAGLVSLSGQPRAGRRQVASHPRT